MAQAHRQDDLRACGAKTVVVGQDFVYVNGKLWAVEGDPDDHGGGGLIATVIGELYINGKKAIAVGDPANPDNLCSANTPIHCAPSAVTGEPNLDVT